MIRPIIWEADYYDVDGMNGRVNGVIMFTIDRKWKRNVKYVLQSYPFHSGVFTKANNAKKLFEHTDLELVKKEADKHFASFVNMMVEPPKLDPATLVILSVYHSMVNTKIGFNIADVDTLLELAEKFEDKYGELKGKIKWEDHKIGWENTVILFYNANKPSHWNRI